MRVSKLIVRERVQALGWPGWVGAACFVLVIGYGLFGLLPSWHELSELQLRAQAAAERQQRIDAGEEAPVTRPADVVGNFYRGLPAQLEATKAIDRIYVLARQESIALERGEYSLGVDPKTRLARYQILLPVRGSYPQLRRFLHTLLSEMSGVVLEDVEVQRKSIVDSELTGRLRVTLYLARNS